MELKGTQLTWLMSPRHSPPVRRSGSHGKASRHCLTLFYPAFKKSCYCIKDKLSSANGMQNVLKECIVCMNVNVCMIYTDKNKRCCGLHLAKKIVCFFLLQNLPFLSMGHMSIAHLTV